MQARDATPRCKHHWKGEHALPARTARTVRTHCTHALPHAKTQSAPIYLLNCSNRRFGTVFEEYGFARTVRTARQQGHHKDTPELGGVGCSPSTPTPEPERT